MGQGRVLPVKGTGPGHSNPGHSNPGHSNSGHSNPGHSNSGHSNPENKINNLRISRISWKNHLNFLKYTVYFGIKMFNVPFCS